MGLSWEARFSGYITILSMCLRASALRYDLIYLANSYTPCFRGTKQERLWCRRVVVLRPAGYTRIDPVTELLLSGKWAMLDYIPPSPDMQLISRDYASPLDVVGETDRTDDGSLGLLLPRLRGQKCLLRPVKEARACIGVTSRPTTGCVTHREGLLSRVLTTRPLYVVPVCVQVSSG